MVAMRFRINVCELTLQKLEVNLTTKAATNAQNFKCPTIGAKFLFKSGQNPPLISWGKWGLPLIGA